MKKTNNVLEGNGNVMNVPGGSSAPKGVQNDTGVKHGIGIPNAASSKDNHANKAGNNKKKWSFPNERPIY